MTDLSEKQTQAWRDLEDPEVLEVFAGGGAGGGKSYLGCLWQIYRRTTFAGTRGFIGREDFTSLRDSTMKTYFSVLEQMGYRAEEHYRYNGQERTIYFLNGSEQHFRHMSYMPSDPNYNRFGSTEYTDAFVDEAPEVDERACQVLLSRLRYGHGKHGITPGLLYTGNPGESWIKREFVMDAYGNLIDLPKHRRRVLFTILDNPDEALRKSYPKTLAHLSPYDRARLLEGDWAARPNVENPFAHAFDMATHTGRATRRPQDYHYFFLDFNVEPFAATVNHIWSDAKGDHFHTFAEAHLERQGIESMAAWVRSNCKYLHLARFTGDRGGNSRQIGMKGPVQLFKMLQHELKISEKQFTVPGNPSHLKSREDYNYVLTNHPDRIIDTTCRNLISDIQTVEVDLEGEIQKSDRKKKEQRADYLDCDRYGVNTYLRKWIDRHRGLKAA